VSIVLRLFNYTRYIHVKKRETTKCWMFFDVSYWEGVDGVKKVSSNSVSEEGGVHLKEKSVFRLTVLLLLCKTYLYLGCSDTEHTAKDPLRRRYCSPFDHIS